MISDISKEVTLLDRCLATAIRRLRGSNKPNKFIYKYSKMRYKEKDSFARYFIEKYRGYSVGKYTWGYWNADSDLIKSIGAFCSIASPQHIVPNRHRIDYVTTWDTMVDYNDGRTFDHTITIGNDVWIGANVTIFDNVTIGDGAVIGTGAIINKDVPPYAIVVGVNRILRYRFSQEIIDDLLAIKWWDWDDEKIFSSIPYMSDPRDFIQRFKMG